MMKTTILTSVAILAIIGLVAFGINTDNIESNLTKNLTEPKTVPYVDIDKYLGAWYEQSTIPFYFERGCTKTVATYSWNADKKSVKVDNSCIRYGKLVESVGKAIPEDDTHAKLKV
jgi:apolipoprotein D and lipocalin family protein